MINPCLKEDCARRRYQGAWHGHPTQPVRSRGRQNFGAADETPDGYLSDGSRDPYS